MITYDRLLSTDNPKAAKAANFGWINGIHYMAPAHPRHQRLGLIEAGLRPCFRPFS